MTKAIVFGHADGDGHIAAVQSAENLSAENIDVQDIVVDPNLTRNFRFWEHTFKCHDFGSADLIVVVDIMLNPRDPLRSFEVLTDRASEDVNRRFVVIDHHPVEGLPCAPKNVEIKFSDCVYNCCYGIPSELMLIAAICDKDERLIESKISDTHRKRALGISRAVSDRMALAGATTIRLIEDRAWSVFEQLADEPASFHRTFYGNRVLKKPESPMLQLAHAIRNSA